MPSSTVPELQQKLFKRMGLGGDDAITNVRDSFVVGSSRRLLRKDKRKGTRQGEMAHNPSQCNRPVPESRVKSRRQNHGLNRHSSAQVHGNNNVSREKTSADGIDDRPQTTWLNEGQSSSAHGYGSKPEDCLSYSRKASEVNLSPTRPEYASEAVQSKFTQDDAEIDAYERKLGIKNGRKSLPKSFATDGLSELLAEPNTSPEQDDVDFKKRKRVYDDWLAAKRHKGSATDRLHNSESTQGLINAEEEEINIAGTAAKSDQGGLSRPLPFDADWSKIVEGPRKRENPYVAPLTQGDVAKYVPPSLRHQLTESTGAKGRIRRQLQGLINRLTDDNIFPIVQSVEEIYSTNARRDVTEVLTDVLLAQVCKPEALPDQFFVLTGGFAAAIYRITGTSFGGHLIKAVVDSFKRHFRCIADSGDTANLPKETSNLLALLSQLYTFEVVTCRIVFDYLETLLAGLSEIKVELLLRLCRMAGRLLRQDDPQALKHISDVLRGEISRIGYANVPARTKFMVETIEGLKSNKSKARRPDVRLLSDHAVRIKKRLADIKTYSRRLDGLAPMGMGLRDLEAAESIGEWWLVGARVTGNSDALDSIHGSSVPSKQDNSNTVPIEEDMDLVLPDYPKRARSQGLSTKTQVAIFTALMSAASHEQGYQQFARLGLKSNDQLELAKVLVQCVGSEASYNSYYALVGQRACTNSKIKFALQDRLWKIFRGLGEPLFGRDEQEDDDDSAESNMRRDDRRLRNVGKFYASLIANKSLDLLILKPLNLPGINQWSSLLIGHMLASVLIACKSKNKDREEDRLEKAMGSIRGLPVLVTGLTWFLSSQLRNTSLVSRKDREKLEALRGKAIYYLQNMQRDK